MAIRLNWQSYKKWENPIFKPNILTVVLELHIYFQFVLLTKLLTLFYHNWYFLFNFKTPFYNKNKNSHVKSFLFSTFWIRFAFSESKAEVVVFVVVVVLVVFVVDVAREVLLRTFGTDTLVEIGIVVHLF